MIHQTLIPSSSPFFLHANNAAAAAPAPCSSTLPSLRGSAMPSYANHRSPLNAGMDAMKDSGFPPEETAEEATAVALVERDGFAVEDLLDLEDFGEPDKDGADQLVDAPPPTEKEKSPDVSQPSSTVTYEPLQPSLLPEMVDLPPHDVDEELEWVSRIMDDSLSELPPPPQPLAMAMAASQAARTPLAHRRPYDGAYRALPIALGPPRTPTVCALSTEARVPYKARRSKRSRSSAWSLSGASLLSDSTSSSSTATTSSCSASFSPFFPMDSPSSFGSGAFEGYRHLLPLPPKKSKLGKGGKHKPKKRGRKPKHAPHLPGTATTTQSTQQGDRRCSHCGVQKTPQWRAGPEGAKTLCNACGVRYKSGRLLPEYRPACSPTFVSSIHSNSHRKVLEMRSKKEAGTIVAAVAPAVASF